MKSPLYIQYHIIEFIHVEVKVSYREVIVNSLLFLLCRVWEAGGLASKGLTSVSIKIVNIMYVPQIWVRRSSIWVRHS